MSIVIENLSFDYGSVQALRGVSARAEAGRITVVLGPNAAGKSTLLRCIIGALRPRSGGGRILIDDLNVAQLSARRLAQRIAYVPQRATVAAAFTVRQVVELGRFARTPDIRKISAAIDMLELGEIADRPYLELSVGQQQRVTLARALAQLAPSGHLIMDEPVSAMDLRHAHQSLDIVRRLASGGATVIMVLHDLSLAAAIAHDAWLIDRGGIVSTGPVGEVLQPQRLKEVFGVPFEWLDTPWGSPILASPHATPLA